MILQSHPEVGGLQYTSLGASHTNWYYQYAVYPGNWINHSLSTFWAGAREELTERLDTQSVP